MLTDLDVKSCNFKRRIQRNTNVLLAVKLPHVVQLRLQYCLDQTKINEFTSSSSYTTEIFTETVNTRGRLEDPLLQLMNEWRNTHNNIQQHESKAARYF